MGIEVVQVPELERFEVRVDGELAGFAEWRGKDPRAFTHTEVDPRFEGRGLGTRLVEHALADAREHGLHVLPMCPFFKAWLGKHPEVVEELVLPQHRAAFGLAA